MKKIIFLSLLIGLIGSLVLIQHSKGKQGEVAGVQEPQAQYWFLLYRKSGVEKLYYGQPGNEEQSALMKTFTVKTGVSGKKPTPLPQLVGREYWVIVEKL
ncbi:MAG TPA: hypothetical protein PLS49_07195, partial [Candidatus Woesebacteria bacterium]|nr:hypothetical protein [Candidatus Woesebacteria bacterium]